MKAHISARLLRLSVITVLVMTIVASLIQPVPASAAPEQGDGYWTDSFTDSTGISDSTNITVSGGEVRLDTTDIPTVAFSDSFEVNLDKWNDFGTTAWDLVTDRFHDGSRSVKASNNNEGYLTSDNIDLSNATSATLDFWFNKDDTEGQDFTLYFYDGNNWNLISELDTLGGDDVWLHYNQVSIAIPSYGVSNFRIRFDATLGIGENVWVDQLTVTKTVNQYCASGSLNSVSITPSNLQSWGTFSATDDNPTFCLAYRKPISITGTGTALADYQINLPVSYVSGMNSDFSELRFKDSSGNILSYWIESYVASTSAQVWVKVPSIAAIGTTTIYMYYGNAGASSASNGEDTFIFFDDFSGDLSKWNTHVALGTVGINAGAGYPAPCLEIGGGSTSAPYGFTAVGTDASYSAFQNGIIEADIYPATDALPEIIFRGNYASNTGYKGRWDCRNNNVNESPFMVAPYSGWPPFGTIMPHFGLANQWQKVKLSINGSTFSIYSNDMLKSTEINTSYTGPGEIGFANHYGSFARLDNIRVRKYASPEPIVNTGSEESGSYCGFSNPGTATSITYEILNAADNSVLCTITAAQAAEGYDISSCAASATSIKLRAELSTGDTSQTPILYEWTVTWSSVIPVSIEITAPLDITTWDLYPDISENANSGTLSVDVTPADATWSVTAQDLDAINTNGFMTLWEGSSYNTSVKLATAMKVSGSGPLAGEVTLPNIAGIPVATGTGDYPSINIIFKQMVTWDDAPGTYQIVVTFIGTVN